MIVVADASPLNYLFQINCDTILPELYERVFVPATVIEELRHPSAPLTVAAWLHQIPEWIEVRVVSVKQDAALEVLDPGEREAIQLAEEQHADLLLIDERHGRLEAKRRGIATTGTLGVLLVIWSDTRNVDPFAPANGVTHDEDVFTKTIGLRSGVAKRSVGQIGQS